MSLKVIKASAQLEKQDEFHLARLILLLNSFDDAESKFIEGITKLAKLDFLLRYPNCLDRVVKAKSLTKAKGNKAARDAQPIMEEETKTIEAKMIRFRYGPWDDRYRRWIGLLIARGLVDAFLDNKTVNLKITNSGKLIATRIASQHEFHQISMRSDLVIQLVGSMGATALKNYIYEIVPEITSMKWGDEISI
ncbi:hypothetical protein [Hymenobacter yonginensis]|uniref:Uncharacterized protein n=1 Tax=Hymenobacter yonginensis TaxID=748197 RepID=A0ABY7PTN7_9BACT|nr:hypothetical protein [Hymenobacter yonginensis]WBO86281.1 hypothetical protein O9Z63_08460 [Hymenobacter yonginensis]